MPSRGISDHQECEADSVVRGQRTASQWSHRKLHDGFIMYARHTDTRWDDREQAVGHSSRLLGVESSQSPCVTITELLQCLV